VITQACRLHKRRLCAVLHRIESIELARCHRSGRQPAPEVVRLRGRAVELHDQLAPSTIATGVTSVRMEPGHRVAEALECGAQA